MYHGALALARVHPSSKIDIFARHEAGEPREAALHPRVRMIRLPLGPADKYLPKERFWGRPILSFAQAVDEFAERNGLSYDLIHGHYADGWYVAQWLSEEWNRPFVCSTHSLGRRKLENALRSGEADRGMLEQKYAFRERIRREDIAIRTASRICALTCEEAEYLVDEYAADRERIRVVHNGTNTAAFSPADRIAATAIRRRLNTKPGEQIVLHVGRLDERKGQRELIEAAPGVVAWAKSKGIRVRFVFLGWTQSHLSEVLERRIGGLGLVKHTALLAPVPHDEVASYYWASNVVTVSSSYDILPLAMMEAMAAGKPVVATRNGGPAEIIRPGTDGMLVDVNKPQEFSEAISTVLGNSDFARSLGLAAKDRMLSDFSWDQAAWRMLSVYREALRRGEPAAIAKHVAGAADKSDGLPYGGDLLHNECRSEALQGCQPQST
jgi:glycosyltransferase involved in cell wall biosynthesis